MSCIVLEGRLSGSGVKHVLRLQNNKLCQQCKTTVTKLLCTESLNTRFFHSTFCGVVYDNSAWTSLGDI